MTPEPPIRPEPSATEITMRVVEDTHTFYGYDGSAWWSGGYAPVTDDGSFIALMGRTSATDPQTEAEHQTAADPELAANHPAAADPRVLFCAVAGAKHRPAALQDSRFEPPAAVLLRPEPDNPHDSNAVGVWDTNGELQLGYVPAGLSAQVAAELRVGSQLSGLILREIRQDSKDGPRVSLHMALALAPGDALKLTIVS